MVMKIELNLYRQSYLSYVVTEFIMNLLWIFIDFIEWDVRTNDIDISTNLYCSREGSRVFF